MKSSRERHDRLLKRYPPPIFEHPHTDKNGSYVVSMLPANTGIRHLGRGAYGNVTQNQIIDSKQMVAVKHFEDSHKGLTIDVLREIHSLQLMKNCANVLGIIAIGMMVKDDITSVEIMISYHTADLYYFIDEVSTMERIKILDEVMKQLLNALGELYQRGILHRDIKPQNILVEYDYNKSTAQLNPNIKCYLADFGLSRQIPCNFKQRNVYMTLEVYTSWYRPPEIIADMKNYKENAEIWALGATLVEYICKIPLMMEVNDDYKKDLIEQIFKLLSKPLEMNEYNIQRFEQINIHDTINVSKFLKDHMNATYYKMVPQEIIDNITSMLQVNPHDRPSITAFIPKIPLCPRVISMPSRGNLYRDTEITPRMYYILVDWLIDVSKMFKLDPKSLVCAIDLLDRYLANYDVKKVELQLVGITCLDIIIKMIEVYPNEISDYIMVTDNAYTLNELKKAEVLITARMNYIMISCDVDDIVYLLRTLGKRYQPILKDTYQTLKNKGLYPGSISYILMKEYIEYSIKYGVA